MYEKEYLDRCSKVQGLSFQRWICLIKEVTKMEEVPTYITNLWHHGWSVGRIVAVLPEEAVCSLSWKSRISEGKSLFKTWKEMKIFLNKHPEIRWRMENGDTRPI